MSVKKYLTLNGLAYFLNKIKSTVADELDGKSDVGHTHTVSDITDIDDYATKQYVDDSISGLVDNAPDALNTLNELSASLNDDSNFATTVTNALSNKANSADLATVATSGDYNDLDNLPTIPTKTSDLSNDSDFVVSSSLATVATSGDYDDLDNKPSIPTNTSDLNNDSGFVTLNDFDIPSKTSDLSNDSGFITSSDVPTSTSDLINDSNFVDTSNSAVASGITSAKVTDYDDHIADTDIHVTTADKANWDSKQDSLSQDQIDAIAQVATNTNDIATLQSDKADASHTHSSSDITDLATVATSGDYDDLYNKPNLATVATSGSYDDLYNKPNLATVATSGSYDDLSDKPIIPDVSNYYTKEEILALLEDYQRKGDKTWVN